MRATEHAPRDPLRGLERRHGLAEIVERGSLILEERQRVKPPHSEKGNVSLAENASCHGYNLAHQRTGFFVATKTLHEALSVREAEVAMLRRAGDPEEDILQAQNNLAVTYRSLGRLEDALRLRRDVYSGRLKLSGEESEGALIAANNYANLLEGLNRHEEASSLLRKNIPIVRRVLGESYQLTLEMRWLYAVNLFRNDGATLDDLREGVETLEAVAPLWTRIFGPAHPETAKVQGALEDAREALAIRTAASSSGAA